MTRIGPHLAPPHAQQLQARVGARLGAALNRHSTALPHDIHERLRLAREQALRRAAPASAAARAPTAPSRGLAQAPRPRGASGWGHGGWPAAGGSARASGWQRVLAVMPVLALFLGLWLIQGLSAHEQALAAADIDARLLADELPPAAYSDPGFAEFLRRGPR